MIALGCDAAGFALMKEIKAYLQRNGIEYKDFGTFSEDPVDYPVYASKVARSVLDGESQKGILICGTGIGISIAANRFADIRCALVHDVFSAKSTRSHNDSNILAMGGRVIGAGLAVEIVDTWLNEEFSGELRHQKRIELIDSQMSQQTGVHQVGARPKENNPHENFGNS
jgi:ribose 5-phosphate isomerase B